uniref:Putative secreted protein n=1 Tax=Panstrongylus lignarius TaxID=156445 RepID=A0A224Y4X9_9HEMI
MKFLLIATIALICCMYTIQQADGQIATQHHKKPLTGDHHAKPFAATGDVKTQHKPFAATGDVKTHSKSLVDQKPPANKGK